MVPMGTFSVGIRSKGVSCGHSPVSAPFVDDFAHSVSRCGGLLTDSFRSQHRRREERGLTGTSSLLKGLNGLRSSGRNLWLRSHLKW